MKSKKTKEIHFRLSEDEYRKIADRSKKFDSITNFLMRAIEEFSNVNAAENVENRKNIAKFYAKMDEKLAHVGGNLNQAMKRINEAAVAGIPYYALMQNQLMPRVKECYDLCNEIRKDTLELTRKVLNGKKP